MKTIILTKENLKEDGFYYVVIEEENLQTRLKQDYQMLISTGIHFGNADNTATETIVKLDPKEISLEYYVTFFTENRKQE
jgi:hypothetical protein